MLRGLETTSGETKAAVCQRITRALFPNMVESDVAKTGEKISSKVDGCVPLLVLFLYLNL
jgi:hypothetical protein